MMVRAVDIRRARKGTGETQAVFAERLGVDQATVHRWEKKAPEKGLAQRLLQIEIPPLLPRTKSSRNGRGAP